MEYSLYGFPEVYSAAFPTPSADESSFYADLLDGLPNNRILSLGCGYGRIEKGLAKGGRHITGLDLSPAMIRLANKVVPTGDFLVADMKALPLLARPINPPFGAVISTLLSAAYLADASSFSQLLYQIGELLMPRGLLVLELPLSHRPRLLQGVEEKTELDGGEKFSFRYLDILNASPTYAVLDTELTITARSKRFSRRAPLIVYTPSGLGRLFETLDIYSAPRFFAPYDIKSVTDKPPADCLRAVVTVVRER